MRAALDTNLLVYAEGFGDQERVGATRALLERLTDADVVVPVQRLGELFRVLTAKARRPAARPPTRLGRRC
jgi:predicted nucleic acid-binding protein